MRKEIANLWNLIEPVSKGLGFELVELQWGREEGGWVLRTFIDRPFSASDVPRLPGAETPDEMFRPPGVTHEDCEQVSRDVSAALDVADVITHAYRLEVSSPGIDRPIRKEEDFQRFAGRKAKLRTADPVAGRRNFSGTLRGARQGVVDIDSEGQSHQVPIDLIVKANLVPDWAAEFRRAAGAEEDEARRGPRPNEGVRRDRKTKVGSTRSAS